jgi:hypothetical protein
MVWQIQPKRESHVIVPVEKVPTLLMTTTVPLSALATSLEDIDAPLTRRFLFPKEDVRMVSFISQSFA